MFTWRIILTSTLIVIPNIQLQFKVVAINNVFFFLSFFFFFLIPTKIYPSLMDTPRQPHENQVELFCKLIGKKGKLSEDRPLHNKT